MDVEWSPSLYRFIKSLQYNPLHTVPLFTGCRCDSTLENTFVTALLVLTFPMIFVFLAIGVSRLVLALAARTNISSLNLEAMSKSLQDIVLKSLVWFSLIFFPILASRFQFSVHVYFIEFIL